MTTTAPSPSLEAVSDRLASLLSAGGGGVGDAMGFGLAFESDIRLRALPPGSPPDDLWAVDGGQALVADARCLQLLVTRASRVRFRAGACVVEEEGEIRAHLLGGDETRSARAGLGLTLAADSTIDANLLRDRWEWEAVERCVAEAEDGAFVLIDGDLQPDWRIPSSYLADLLEVAARRQITLVGVTKHSSLSRGGAPLIGQLEVEAETRGPGGRERDALGPRARWWAPIAHTRPDVGYGLQVVVARLDPDARFAFRIDLPANVDAAAALGRVAAVCDDAAFPGYPYPLGVADRLAACSPWIRHDLWLQVDEHLEGAGVGPEVRERAFADRHGLMERY
ncbi:MAG TPA: DNA double-strand break repair nuclease NurA [Acidimicrobiales bacterium]|nr:DNA double-strand break repair nuclease NurA [Acidimicrobiales bacterium]